MPCSTLLFGAIALSLSFFFHLETAAYGYTAASTKSAKNPYIVVLDAGHGGTDHGAEGEKGKGAQKKTVLEKDLSLGIVIRLSRLLQDPQYWKPLGRPIRVVLTREKDTEVSLESRAELAKKLQAHLFVSIHINSDPKKQARGIETYILNNTDRKTASKLEEIENKLSKKYADVRPNALLIHSIATDAVMENSRQAAEALHSSILRHLKKRDIPLHDRGVRQALLYVLLDSQVPAVLFEAGYISNAKDLELLESGSVRQEIAEGLAKGILRYLVLL